MGAVLDFLNQRKEKWLSGKINNKMSESEVAKLKIQAEEKFSIDKWVSGAAKRASQLSLASHVCKFSHPDSKTSSVIETSSFSKDGYLRSGNVEYNKAPFKQDAYGNAAAIDVFEFLMTPLQDGKTVIEHLEKDSAEIQAELAVLIGQYTTIKSGLLAIKKEKQEISSDERIKQVFFPVGDTYHLLSLLTSSVMVSEMRERIEEIRKNARAARGIKNEQYGNDYSEISNLTVIGFGGTKPVNISALNNRNNGKAYLLSSCPPNLSSRDVARPRSDFFANTLRSARFGEWFRTLHNLLGRQQNNQEMRNKVKDTVTMIIDQVMISVYRLRQVEPGWSTQYNQLPLEQKIWLDEAYSEKRKKDEEWMDKIALSFARWIMHTYEKTLKDDSIQLGDGELAFLQGLIIVGLQEDKENWG